MILQNYFNNGMVPVGGFSPINRDQPSYREIIDKRMEDILDRCCRGADLSSSRENLFAEVAKESIDNVGIPPNESYELCEALMQTTPDIPLDGSNIHTRCRSSLATLSRRAALKALAGKGDREAIEKLREVRAKDTRIWAARSAKRAKGDPTTVEQMERKYKNTRERRRIARELKRQGVVLDIYQKR